MFAISSSSRPFLFGAVLLGLSSVPLVACLKEPEQLEKARPVTESPALPPGNYVVQSLSYDDADGAYRAFLLEAPPALKGPFTTTSLRMARLTDEEIAAGLGTHLSVDAEGTTAKLTPEFAIQYTHNVTEDIVDPQSGRTETVVVRQESSTWSPFMGMMAGMAISNMLFSPMYHYPPPYMRGSALMGSGGYGPTRVDAQRSFQSNHGSLPQSAKLSQSGFSKKPSASMKSTGSGAGSSRMAKPTTSTPKPRSGFGSGFGGGRRRR